MDLVSHTPRPCLLIYGVLQIIARKVAKWRIAQMYLCETKYREGGGEGGVAPLWGASHLSGKVSRDVGYRSDSIVSRDMVPLRAEFESLLSQF